MQQPEGEILALKERILGEEVRDGVKVHLEKDPESNAALARHARSVRQHHLCTMRSALQNPECMAAFTQDFPTPRPKCALCIQEPLA